MSDDITYNQIIFLTNDSFTCQTVKKSFIEKGKRILIVVDSKKIIISGKNIDASGHRRRIIRIPIYNKTNNCNYKAVSNVPETCFL